MGVIYKNGIPYGNQPYIDATLTQQGEAADAKAVGDEISDVRNTLDHKADVIYDTASGPIASFPDGADGLPVKDLTVSIEPVQSGTGDPSPTNVRPISGWTGANVTKVGKNLGNQLAPVGTAGITWDSELNAVKFNSTYTTPNKYTAIYVAKSNSQITVSYDLRHDGNDTGDREIIRILYTDGTADRNISGSSAVGTWRHVSLTSNPNKIVDYVDYSYLYGSAGYPSYIKNVQVELGSVGTAYEPYSGTTLPISWQSEAGTVYGGTLDVTSGVLTATMGYVDLGTLNPLISSLVSNGVTISISNAKKWVGGAYLPNGLNSAYKKVLSNEQYFTGGAEWTIRLSTDAGGILMSNPQWAGKTAEQIKADLSGVYYCYELATPQTYQLDPVTVSTLLGQNNIWADTGDSAVEYPCDTKLYIQKINAPSDDDMIADANIASGQYFIVNNNLYLSTAAILAGDPIKPGTNCTLTNLAAALNALNS